MSTARILSFGYDKGILRWFWHTIYPSNLSISYYFQIILWALPSILGLGYCIDNQIQRAELTRAFINTHWCTLSIPKHSVHHWSDSVMLFHICFQFRRNIAHNFSCFTAWKCITCKVNAAMPSAVLVVCFHYILQQNTNRVKDTESIFSRFWPNLWRYSFYRKSSCRPKLYSAVFLVPPPL